VVDSALPDSVLTSPRPYGQQRLLLLASGGGSNAQRLLAHFAPPHSVGHVVGLLSNNPTAGALAHAARAGVPTYTFGREEWRDGRIQQLIEQEFRPDLIVLAGFLWLVPAALVTAYAGRILNIHPSLLPKFGGKGMHGQHVHEAVLAAHEPESGITIHLVNAQYDDGAVLFQARCPVLPDDTPAALAARVLALEHRYLPLVVEAVLRGLDPAAFARQALGASVPADEIIDLS
jgi:phosphoribosylglycinamide formyltransferase 1